MLITINRRAQMVVDLSSLEAVRNAVAVDLDASTVMVVERTATGEVQTTHHYPQGLRLVRRY
jgi:hypothetical protein